MACGGYGGLIRATICPGRAHFLLTYGRSYATIYILNEKELINMEEIISLVFLIVAAWYGLYRLLRALWEHDNSNESCKKGVDSSIEPWYNKYNK
jgi:hypothetical protein